MTTAYTSLLGFALPVTGELSGTWGDTVNNGITSLLDSAIAGTTTLSADSDVTLTTTQGSSNTAREAILLWTAGGTATRTITAPAQSKIYTVINASSGTQSIILAGAGPTSGVTIAKGESALCAWNGSDFIKISNTAGPGTFTNLTVTGNTSLGDADTDTITQAASYVTGTQLKSAKTATNTLSLAAYDVDGTAYTNLITLTASNTPTLALTSTGVGTINNMSIGATTASTGAFTTLSASGAVTLSGGTANGVAYLNGSKVLTTGSALTFDGSVFKNTGTITSGGNGCLLALNSAADGIYIVGGNKSFNAFSVGDYGIGSVGALKFASNNAINATLDSSGNLGLGVTPSAWSSALRVFQFGANASIYGNGSNTAFFGLNFYTDSGSTNRYLTSNIASAYGQNSGQHQWYTAASGTAGNAITFTQAMTLDASGRFLVGGTTSSGSEFRAEFFSGSATSPVCINIGRTGVDTLIATAGATNNFVTGTAQGDSVIRAGANLWLGSNGANNILFYTSGANERARIDSSGNLLVKKTSSGIGSIGVENLANGAVFSTLAGSTSATSSYNLYSTGAAAYRFYVGMDGTINATSIVITAISDQRLKENVRDIDTGLNEIMSLKPRRFDWKEGKGQDKKNAAGFIAQEFEDVFPECVSTSKAGGDGVEYKNINHETLIPTLVKAIQELKAEIDSLKSQLNGA